MSNLFGDDADTPQKKGGKARAEILPPARRSEIARGAAQARWQGNNSLPQVLCGSTDRPMRIPALGLEIPCYVIEGERRVLVQTGMINALNLSRGGSAKSGGDRLAKFVGGARLGPFVSKDLINGTQAPLKFRTPNGQVAYGYDAEVLHQICLAVLEARRAGRLQYQQQHVAVRCEILIAAWSLAGIVSAVDEATGFQYIRAKTAIEDIIDKWLVKELQPWKKQFPVDYYKRIHELNSWPFNPQTVKRPGVIGHWTNDIVYDRLGTRPPGAASRLCWPRRKGPAQASPLQILDRASRYPRT